MKSTFAGRSVILLSDARFTTQRFLKDLPKDPILVGRLRKDAKLFTCQSSNRLTDDAVTVPPPPRRNRFARTNHIPG